MLDMGFEVKDEVTPYLEGIEDADRLERMLLDRMAEKIVGNVKEKKLSGQVLNVRTGRLKTSIGKRSIGNDAVDIGVLLSTVKYAAIHEFGGDIYPKNAGALTFQIGDKWITTGHVHMKKRPYVKPAIDEFFNGSEHKRVAEATVQQFLDGEI